MVHFYIGDGKGKTTAALGLALRLAGFNKKAYIGQFLKDVKRVSGEIEFVKRVKTSVVIERFRGQIHPMFLKKGEKADAKKLKESIRKALLKIEGYINQKKFDLIVLDEILNAVGLRACPKAVLKRIIKKGASIEIILTGRRAPSDLIKLADYVSLIKKVKHPFDKGICARRGIEY
ncbi:MAG: cob(I)yrinic acid a,c-diamide adenosyltransferase [Candidatus Omnitrophota bacterium]|nr:MAG: cob(I)yrinic acid a,c-diamide adenosyltransferase [Candidatus Omnitrophota bacterium]